MTPSRKTSIYFALLIACAIPGARDRTAFAQVNPPSTVATSGSSVDNAPSSTSVSVGRSGRSWPVGERDPYGASWWRLQANEGRLTEPVLVIPAKEVDVDTVSGVVEDLSVMGRIIQKNALSTVVSPDRRSLPLLGRLRWGADSAGPEVLFSAVGRPKPLYVGGYGAVFFVQVDFPLVAPPAAKDEAPPAEQADAVWAETRRGLFEPQPSGVVVPGNADASEPYSGERVATLKGALIATMKHAANIRALEPGERLTIVVQGPSPQTKAAASAGALVGNVPDGRSVLTLRAGKADIDLYAKGELSQAQFEQRVQVVTY